MALAIRSAISFLSVSALAGIMTLGCSSSNNDDSGVTGTGGAKATGGAKPIGGNKATGGASAVATGGAKATGGSGTKATGGTAAATGGTKATGGAAGGGTTAGVGGTTAAVGGTTAAAGGTTAAVGGTSSAAVGGTTAAVGGTTAAAGGTTAAVGGTSSAAGASSTLPQCSTTTTDAGPIEVCSPPETVNPGNTGTSPNRDPDTDPFLGAYQYHVYNGVIQLYGEVAAPGRFWQGSPYTDAICAGRGVDATGKNGIRVTLKNSAANAMTLDLYVKDQAGDGPTYVTVPLKKSVVVAAGGATAAPVTIDVPFADFVADCSTSVPFNAATIMQLGLGFGSTGALDLTITSFTFY